jgi:Fe-S oxidoreductase
VLDHIRKTQSTLIQNSFPPLSRRSSGYQLLELIKPFPINLAKLIAGSEGTLGIISSLKVRIDPVLPETELHLFPFDSMMEAMRAVQPLLKTNPIALEMIDDKILTAGMQSPALRGKLGWLKTIPKALLVAEYQAPHPTFAPIILKTPRDMQNVWDVRKAGLGLLLSKRSYSRAVAFIEDISVPPDALPEFMETFLKYLQSVNREAGIYGHVGPGCLHIRPYMDIRKPEEIREIKTMMQDVAKMLKKAKGALSGEHGDGLIRTWLNQDFFGEEIYQIFLSIKNAFDPLHLMNPHKIVNPITIETHIRPPPLQNPETFLKFDGGLALAADLCNGNGACRKKEGVMCPSFQVTSDEYDTTRARANLFRGIMQGTKKADLADPDLHAILDLCIQCKGCKTECPSQVDMAKMKSEALYHYQEKNGYSFRSALFAYIDKINKWTYPFPSHLIGKKFLSFFGIGHSLPKFSSLRFSKNVHKIQQPNGEKVVLLSDSYTEFYCSEVGFAAVQLLNKLGFEAIVPPWTCCGRPAMSKGFLKHAKKNAEVLSAQLMPYQNIPIISLEPSCMSMLHEEFADLTGNTIDCVSLDAFLAKHLKLKSPKTIALHRHCHQKEMSNLTKIEGLTVIEIPSGCCGMAGSFGYESEHTAFSKKIGELKLLPFVRALDPTIPIIATGYSCRTQIELYTNRKAYHLAEWLVELI